MGSATAKNLHVPLSPQLYRALRSAAERRGRPATQVAREAIVQFLASEKKREIEDELRVYVDAVAGSAADLDPVLEAAAAHHVLSTRRKRR